MTAGNLIQAGTFLLFLYLKLTHYITWSWLWVLSPLWLPYGIILTLVAFFIVLYFFCVFVKLLLEKTKSFFSTLPKVQEIKSEK